LEPSFTLPNASLAGVTVMSTVPVPLSVTCCGLVAVLSLSVSVALCAPSVLGVNATPSVHNALGATVTGIAPHVPVPLTAYSESDGIALEMTSELVLPVFSTVRFFVTVSPTGSLPNASDAVTNIEVVGVAVGVAVAVAVAVGVAVAVAVAVAVGVAVAVAVTVAVAVGVAVCGWMATYIGACSPVCGPPMVLTGATSPLLPAG